MATLEAVGISKTYIGPDKGAVKVLEDVNLQFDGGVHAIVGASGCGKSTLLMICGALLHPDYGNIRIDGQDPFSIDASGSSPSRVSMLGYVFQDFHLIPYLSVQENILASTLAMRGEDMAGECLQLAEELGLSHRLNHRPGELSAGEQQRVAIARAILCKPKLLIADEPTGSLDTGNGKAVINILRDYADKGGLVLLATHNPLVAESADSISTIEDLGIVPYSLSLK